MSEELNEIDEASEDGFPVALPSGAVYHVLAQSEVAYVQERAKQYTETFRWDNVSDIQDVDRIVIMELLCYRWGKFLALGKDYFGDEVQDERELRKNLKEYAAELRQLKKSIGIDKATREKETGADSVPAYLEQLRIRAKEFGINRDKMQAKTIELGQQVIALVTLWDRCDEQEQIENRATANDVCEWLRDVFIPEFQAVDKAFREGHQKMWIAQQ
jgi:hypothetical protein